MKSFLIIVEGKNDAVFIKDYLSFLYGFILKDETPKKKVLVSDNLTITILAAGGYTAISKCLRTRLEEIRDMNIKLIVIQDADDPHKDPLNGGKELRNKYLNEIKSDLLVDFDTFLFPNDKDNGDIETLLLRIVNEEKYNKSYKHYKNYSDSLCEIADIVHSQELLQEKCKVYSYIRTYNGMESAKEENRKFINEYWNLTTEELSPLRRFFEKHFTM
jgi:hypothetical protein